MCALQFEHYLDDELLVQFKKELTEDMYTRNYNNYYSMYELCFHLNSNKLNAALKYKFGLLK